ncbi:sigma-54-dependent transcriptional regulator [Sporolactobacillus sp. THM7-4]|nr:sigma-54-dependent transcriptional regulator [Sporolactobacillus sp. THM7-4]
MTRRKERVYQELVRQCSRCDKKTLLERSGVSAAEIAANLDMLRSNVSLELNNLVREKRVIKFVTRPVLYIPADLVEQIFGNVIDASVVKARSLNDLLHQNNVQSRQQLSRDPFNHLIGASQSLKTSVIQAKAAVVYPPHGLNTLILGPTGSGKTLFAHMMHNYAMYKKRMAEDSPFIVFNCADYYNNSQLLLGQLFGYVKGAFTGADSDTDGLVAKADKGILFLDEIHRLPPEGQEMIFYFMDTGKYSKLGETGCKRESHVLIIGATTADPESALLQTFLRRIPVMITMPTFSSRTALEKVELTKLLLSHEAQRTNNQFKVSADVIRALIGSVSFGNVGQLKSNVQLICARGFLDNFNSDCIQLDARTLPPEMKEGLSAISRNDQENSEISKYLPSTILITGRQDRLLTDDDSYEPPFDMYKIIAGKYNFLSLEGLSTRDIKEFIYKDIKAHFKRFYQQARGNALETLVDSHVLSLAPKIEAICTRHLGHELSEQFLSFIMLHLDSFLRHKHRKLTELPDEKKNMISVNSNEYRAACTIGKLIVEEFNVRIPEIEIVYIAVLLSSSAELSRRKNVGIVVAAHGDNVASAMVRVTKELLGDYPIMAVDMPLSTSFKDIFSDLVHAVQKMNQGEGVLMMVDMGSLYYFEEKIAESAKTPIRVIDMVSTPLILEAVKKANYLHLDLNSIVESLRMVYDNTETATGTGDGADEKKKAILTICTTGSGTAQRMKTIISGYIRNLTNETIRIIPLSMVGLHEQAQKLLEKYRIIASIGAKDPKLEGVPYITLQQFIGGDSEDIIEQAIQRKCITTKENPSNVIVRGICEDSLQNMLMYLNPKKAVSAIIDFNAALQKTLNIHLKNATQIRIIMHLAFALEREITHTPLKYTEAVSRDKENIASTLSVPLEVIQFKLNITMSRGEIFYLIDMLADELGKSVLAPI